MNTLRKFVIRWKSNTTGIEGFIKSEAFFNYDAAKAWVDEENRTRTDITYTITRSYQ